MRTGSTWKERKKKTVHAKKRNDFVECAEWLNLEFDANDIDVDGVDDHTREYFHFIFDRFF